jgi:hypothetical protein
VNRVVAIVAVVGVFLAISGLSMYSYRAGKAAVQQEWDKEKAAIAQAHLEEMQRARQREAELQAAIDKQTEGYKRDLENITADYQRIVVWLRDRPAARAGAGGVPQGATAGVGCTGAGLSRADAEFLARYAADAARTREALDQCVRQYEEVRRMGSR